MPLDLTPLAPAELSVGVTRAAGADAPTPAKMMAARGLAPLGPQELLTAIYQLTHDADEAVANAARESAGELPDRILAGALGEPLDARVLDFFAVRLVNRDQMVEAVLLNGHTHDETFVTLAGCLKDRQLEILAGNQQRLLRHPPIIEALYFNKATRMSTVDRVLELAARNGIEITGIPHFKELADAILGTGGAQPDAETVQQEAAQPAMDDLFASLVDQEIEQEDDLGTLEYESGGDESDRSKNIAQLPVSHKIRLALLGQAGDRALLIKDSNKLVSMSVIKSPKITDPEIIKYAGSRAICEDVIRYIADRREWQKNYQVKVALISNPKCPLGHAMRLLPHLRGKDVRQLARSKNIPSALAQAAKRIAKR